VTHKGSGKKEEKKGEEGKMKNGEKAGDKNKKKKKKKNKKGGANSKKVWLKRVLSVDPREGDVILKNVLAPPTEKKWKDESRDEDEES